MPFKNVDQKPKPWTINEPLFIIKFFKNEDHLDQIVGGLLYLNTPEFYRTSSFEGQSDHNESCVMSYRQSRRDSPIKFEFDGKEISGISAATMHLGEFRDMWLHCWMAVYFPENEENLSELKERLHTLRREFGNNYAAIHTADLESVAKSIKESTNLKFMHGKVAYSDNRNSWNIFCKSNLYAYQNEYRFCIGECGHTHKEHKKIQVDGLRGKILKNPYIKLEDKKTGHRHLMIKKNYIK